jgi:hypothetical protein
MTDQTLILVERRRCAETGTTSTPIVPFRRRPCCIPVPGARHAGFLAVLFPMDLILQEISTERYIEIPGGSA